MATSNLSGLFSNTNRSPRDYRQAYVNLMRGQDASRGSQSTSQSAISLAGDMGTSLGAGLGQLFGGQTSEQVRDAQINEALTQVNAGEFDNESARMQELSRQLRSRGLENEAQQAFDRANQLEVQQSKLDELAFNKANRFADRKETRMVPDGLGGFVPKQFYWTEKYNETSGQWEKMTAPSDTPPPAAGGGGEPKSALDLEAERRANSQAGKPQGGATTTPVAQQPIPTPRVLPPQNTQLTEAERLEQLYYDQQRAANPQAAPAPTRPALPPLTFKSVEDQESAMRRAVAAGNRELAMRIRDAQVGTNR